MYVQYMIPVIRYSRKYWYSESMYSYVYNFRGLIHENIQYFNRYMNMILKFSPTVLDFHIQWGGSCRENTSMINFDKFLHNLDHIT